MYLESRDSKSTSTWCLNLEKNCTGTGLVFVNQLNYKILAPEFFRQYKHQTVSQTKKFQVPWHQNFFGALTPKFSLVLDTKKNVGASTPKIFWCFDTKFFLVLRHQIFFSAAELKFLLVFSKLFIKLLAPNYFWCANK